MDSRGLRELGLLEVARLYALDEAAPAAATGESGLHALVTEGGDWMVLGEGRGDGARERDPFAGAAGKLLDAMLAAVGCRRGGEVASLERQWEKGVPRVILALGAGTASRVLATEASLGALRGGAHRFRDVPLVVTHHPADLLDAPGDKAQAWEDLLRAKGAASGA